MDEGTVGTQEQPEQQKSMWVPLVLTHPPFKTIARQTAREVNSRWSKVFEKVVEKIKKHNQFITEPKERMGYPLAHMEVTAFLAFAAFEQLLGVQEDIDAQALNGKLPDPFKLFEDVLGYLRSLHVQKQAAYQAAQSTEKDTTDVEEESSSKEEGSKEGGEEEGSKEGGEEEGRVQEETSSPAANG